MKINTATLTVTDMPEYLLPVGRNIAIISAGELSLVFYLSEYPRPKLWTYFEVSLQEPNLKITETEISHHFVELVCENNLTKIPLIKELRKLIPNLSLLDAKLIVENLINSREEINNSKFDIEDSSELDFRYFWPSDLYIYHKIKDRFNPHIFFFVPSTGYCCIAKTGYYHIDQIKEI